MLLLLLLLVVVVVDKLMASSGSMRHHSWPVCAVLPRYQRTYVTFIHGEINETCPLFPELLSGIPPIFPQPSRPRNLNPKPLKKNLIL